MMTRPTTRPTEPLVVVLGSTGTGKSDLAVELARRFDGEIINADAMQMYRGLPVTTNKISVEEQRGVPHHLLGTIGLHEPTWHVDRFKREASQIIKEIRSRGRLPIVVGGSQYYTDGLLFEDHLIDEAADSDEGKVEGEDGESNGGEGKQTRRFPILDESTEAMLAELKKVDPVMAERWHPNDRRKIRRSLEIFLKTGRKASDIYAEQRKRREEKESEREGDDEKMTTTTTTTTAADSGHHPWQCLLLWVYSKPDILNARLDARIDTMLERGLEEETSEMHDTLQDFAARGVTVDRSKGIWQSIGFKEMEPYVVAQRALVGDGATAAAAAAHTVPEGMSPAKLRENGLDGIKFGTRRYARYQLRWIKHKTIPYLADVRALDHLFLLDSTDKAQWQQNVAETGAQLTAVFLGRGGDGGESSESLPLPVDVSETAHEVLTATIAASRGSLHDPGKLAYRQTCAICHATLLSEDQWTKHLRSSRHRRVLQKHKRRALVPVPTAVDEEQQPLINNKGAEEGEKEIEGLPKETAQDPIPATDEPQPQVDGSLRSSQHGGGAFG